MAAWPVPADRSAFAVRQPQLSCVPFPASCPPPAAALAPSEAPASCVDQGSQAASLWHSSFGTNRARGRSMLRRQQKTPGRRSRVRQYCGGAVAPSPRMQRTCGLARQCAQIIGRSRQHNERHARREITPAPPARQLLQYVSPHQPDEFHIRKPLLQSLQGINAVSGAQRRLDASRHDTPPVGNNACRSQTIPERRHSFPRLQHIARRNKQPDLIQPQSPPRQLRHMEMPRMRWIERAAENTHAHAPPVAEPRQRISTQGRTWPAPSTM